MTADRAVTDIIRKCGMKYCFISNESNENVILGPASETRRYAVSAVAQGNERIFDRSKQERRCPDAKRACSYVENSEAW